MTFYQESDGPGSAGSGGHRRRRAHWGRFSLSGVFRESLPQLGSMFVVFGANLILIYRFVHVELLWPGLISLFLGIGILYWATNR